MAQPPKTAPRAGRPVGLDPKITAAIATFRARIAERASGILEDLEAIHGVVEDARPLTHTVEAFEALEELDTHAWEVLDGLRTLMARSGFLDRTETRGSA